MNSNFLNIMRAFNQNNEMLDAAKLIISHFDLSFGSDSNLYSDQAKLKLARNRIIDRSDVTNPYIKALIDIESSSPFSIFKFILDEDFSDIMFFNEGYKQSNNKGFSNELFRDTVREDELDDVMSIYRLFLNHLIQNIQVSKGEARFDPSHAILDAEANKYRFNIIHDSLNGRRGWPIIIVRKQTIGDTSQNKIFENYINTVGASEKQIDYIHQYAQLGNIVLFGETGSGKTTMLRYIGNYGIKDKRNLITIEDTSELNINVPLALITNEHNSIKDLFTAALRQNPSHILIGETRTSEIIDIMESALVTSVGTTIHANSFLRAIQRIIFMSVKERDLDTNEIENLINASVDCFIYMDKRKVKQMWVHKQGRIKDVYDAYEEII